MRLREHPDLKCAGTVSVTEPVGGGCLAHSGRSHVAGKSPRGDAQSKLLRLGVCSPRLCSGLTGFTEVQEHNVHWRCLEIAGYRLLSITVISMMSRPSSTRSMTAAIISRVLTSMPERYPGRLLVRRGQLVLMMIVLGGVVVLFMSMIAFW